MEMNEEELIKKCLINDEAILTYPFKDKKYDSMPVIRHKTNRKWFALIYYFENELCVNLKCPPVDCEILRDNYSFIYPAWHMNKSRWNRIIVNKAPDDLLDRLILTSYNLTIKKPL